MVGPGKSLSVLARVFIASEELQQRVKEFSCNSMWDAEVKGFIKEIICKHNADIYLAFHLLLVQCLQVPLTGTLLNCYFWT